VDRKRQSFLSLLALVIVIVFVSGAVSGCGGSAAFPLGHRPTLICDDSVESDFRALALETWDRFLTVFQARADCFGDVHLRASRTLDSRAAYDPNNATVTVRVPGTRAMLQSALIHEWAHHIEFQCEAQKELRPAFLAAQGLPPDTPWRPDDLPVQMPTSTWADIPSEQYAEATIVLVLGERPIPTTAYVSEEGVQVIARWAAGGGRGNE